MKSVLIIKRGGDGGKPEAGAPLPCDPYADPEKRAGGGLVVLALGRFLRQPAGLGLG